MSATKARSPFSSVSSRKGSTLSAAPSSGRVQAMPIRRSGCLRRISRARRLASVSSTLAVSSSSAPSMFGHQDLANAIAFDVGQQGLEGDVVALERPQVAVDVDHPGRPTSAREGLRAPPPVLAPGRRPPQAVAIAAHVMPSTVILRIPLHGLVSVMDRTSVEMDEGPVVEHPGRLTPPQLDAGDRRPLRTQPPQDATSAASDPAAGRSRRRPQPPQMAAQAAGRSRRRIWIGSTPYQAGSCSTQTAPWRSASSRSRSSSSATLAADLGRRDGGKGEEEPASQEEIASRRSVRGRSSAGEVITTRAS